MVKINSSLKNYIQKSIFPIYEKFDEGHNQNHIKQVIRRSLCYYKFLNSNDLNVNMVYTIAAYHDIGISIERKNHPTHSKAILLKDENLRKWFTKKQIEIMADAVEDHSTSSKKEPRSIYGKIVSDADKDTDINIGLMRGWNFALHYAKDETVQERLDNIHREIVKRFGGEEIGGQNLVQFYISSDKNKRFMKQMISFAYHKDKFETKMLALVKKING